MKKKRKIILFDIDRTIFNTEKFSRLTSEYLARAVGAPLEEFTAKKNLYTNSLDSPIDFNPETYVEHLATIYNADKKALRKIFLETPEIYKECLFEESIEILEILSKDHTIGIYSEGHFLFQMSKIQHTGLLKYFQKELVFIEPRKATETVKKKVPAGAVIIDDKIIIVEQLAAWGHIKPIWINRISMTPHATIPTINTLRDLPKKLHAL